MPLWPSAELADCQPAADTASLPDMCMRARGTRTHKPRAILAEARITPLDALDKTSLSPPLCIFGMRGPAVDT